MRSEPISGEPPCRTERLARAERGMAEVKGMTEDALAEHVAANTARAFGY
ncbi:hypothetical protein [Streptomyces armeniacus]|nr:hypothetical protein [Streptomyces armeniacus]